MEITTSRDRENWKVQIFRSIDGVVVIELSDKSKDVVKVGLVTKKINVIDENIHDP